MRFQLEDKLVLVAAMGFCHAGSTLHAACDESFISPELRNILLTKAAALAEFIHFEGFATNEVCVSGPTSCTVDQYQFDGYRVDGNDFFFVFDTEGNLRVFHSKSSQAGIGPAQRDLPAPEQVRDHVWAGGHFTKKPVVLSVPDQGDYQLRWNREENGIRIEGEVFGIDFNPNTKAYYHIGNTMRRRELNLKVSPDFRPEEWYEEIDAFVRRNWARILKSGAGWYGRPDYFKGTLLKEKVALWLRTDGTVVCRFPYRLEQVKSDIHKRGFPGPLTYSIVWREPFVDLDVNSGRIQIPRGRLGSGRR